MSNESKKVGDIDEASSSITELLPIDVKLTNGNTYTVKRMSWIKFQAMWAAITGMVAALLGDGSDIEGTLLSEIAKAPDVMIKLITLSCPLTEADIEGLDDFADVFKLGRAALKVNFVDTKEMFDFFYDAIGAMGMKVQKGSDPQTS